ncbi:MAG: diacylglycerol kinase family protein [Actinomycetota bacterium]|nr:diacylglycerol kinase family protein [Actinomycetota bacterium]
MTTVAVIAHSAKTMGGGLAQLRAVLEQSGFAQPLWYEVAKSSQVPECVGKATKDGADLVFIWGGDGTVRMCVESLAGSGVPIAILPAGTGNLLARNVGVPQDIEKAVAIGLHGDRREIDTATVNGNHFAIMAGGGLDALVMRDASDGMKERFGRVAYLWSGARHLGAKPVKATIDLEGRRFYKGPITCVLFGNMSEVLGGIEVFEGSSADDGMIEMGVVSAKSRTQWLRTLTRAAVGRVEGSPFVSTTRGTSMTVEFDQRVAYEVDGSEQKPTRKLKVKVMPKSTTLCVPNSDQLANQDK